MRALRARQRRVRQVADVDAAADEHQRFALARPFLRCGHEPRLADARVTADEDGGAAAGGRGVHRVEQCRELRRAPPILEG
jgi:hypothetical protein